MLGLYITLGVLLLLAIISVVPINAIFAVSFEDKPAGLEFIVQYLFIKLRILPAQKRDESEKRSESEEKKDEDNEKKKEPDGKKTDAVRKIYRLVSGLIDDATHLLEVLLKRALIIHDFRLSARIGTEDAMYTGIAVGAADAFIYPLLGTIDRNMRLRRFDVSIIPDWSNKVVSGSFYIKVSINIARIVQLGLMLIPIYFKFRKISRSI